MRRFIVSSLPLLLVLTLEAPAFAAWTNGPSVNLPVCTAPNLQRNHKVASDGVGGAFVVWEDQRPGGGVSDIYAQHVLASGSVDPAWPVNGVAVCAAGGNQYFPILIADGSGGALITWADVRTGEADIYVHHLLSSGLLDPAWPSEGRAACAATGSQYTPQLVSDGNGGAILAWVDGRFGTNDDIYAQHVLVGGSVDPTWPVNGRALCVAVGFQGTPYLVADGVGGAIVTWDDLRLGSANWEIYAHHVLASGAADPVWPVDGRALCTAANNQMFPQIAPDGFGGAIVGWMDFRGATADIYVQHVRASGTIDPAWTANGLPVCTAIDGQTHPGIITDGAGGAIVTWDDLRSGNTDVYAQHVLAAGIADPAWPADGRALCVAAGAQYIPSIVSDGTGGAFVAWHDSRSNPTYPDIYAHHVLGSGLPDPSWPVDGRAVTTATGSQTWAQMAQDEVGGVVFVWQDSRDGDDIYAQRMGRHGYLGTPEPEIVSVADVPGDQGGAVKVSWTASYLDQQFNADLDVYDVLRSLPPNLAALRVARGARTLKLHQAPRTGDVITTVSGGQTYFWELLQSVTALHYLSGYSCSAPTPGDSVDESDLPTAFMVVARNSETTQYWPSRPMSGFSVDNLAPATPEQLAGAFSSGTTHLNWAANAEPDLTGYRLYRGSSAAFIPGPGNLIAALTDTWYTDVPGVPACYKLTAVDLHGNESPFAALSPSGTVDVGEPAVLRTLALSAPSPNPAGTATLLSFAVPGEMTVRLTVYDAAGRMVRELANGPRLAGAYREPWDLRDANGRAVGTGLYFARLEATGRTLVRRIAVTR